MAENDNDGAASLNEVFSAAADTISTGLSAIWNYHIPFDSIVLIIGVVVLIPAGVYLAFFLYGTGIVLVRMATWRSRSRECPKQKAPRSQYLTR